MVRGGDKKDERKTPSSTLLREGKQERSQYSKISGHTTKTD